MQKDFRDAHADLKVGVLAPSQWAEFREFQINLKSSVILPGQQQRIDIPEAWSDLLNSDKYPDYRMFGLWERQRLIGIALIIFKQKNDRTVAMFAGGQIADDCLGRRLSRHLYNVRLDYLRTTGFKGDVETYIKPENTPSMRAAKANGFVLTDRSLDYGHCVLVLKDNVLAKAAELHPAPKLD